MFDNFDTRAKSTQQCLSTIYKYLKRYNIQVWKVASITVGWVGRIVKLFEERGSIVHSDNSRNQPTDKNRGKHEAPRPGLLVQDLETTRQFWLSITGVNT